MNEGVRWPPPANEGETTVLSITSASSIRDYPNEFSKRVPISKSLSHFSRNFIQFQSVSDTKLCKKVFLPGKGDPSLAKRPKRSRGTTYLYNFASKDIVNGASGAKAWKGSQMVRGWGDNQSVRDGQRAPSFNEGRPRAGYGVRDCIQALPSRIPTRPKTPFTTLNSKTSQPIPL